MSKNLGMLCALALAGIATASTPAAFLPCLEEWDEFDVLIEINATDGDAGFQGKVDGEPWDKAGIFDPNGMQVFVLKPKNQLKAQGVTEFMWESAEPDFGEFTLDDFLDRFPEGTYQARASTLEGGRLWSESELTHNLPAGPVITSHEDGDEVELENGENLVVTWDPVVDDYRGGPLATDIVLYYVVAEWEGMVGGEEVKEVMEMSILPTVTSMEIPNAFLIPGRTYKIEIGAREEDGNQTFTELEIEIDD